MKEKYTLTLMDLLLVGPYCTEEEKKKLLDYFWKQWDEQLDNK